MGTINGNTTLKELFNVEEISSDVVRITLECDEYKKVYFQGKTVSGKVFATIIEE